MSSVRRGGSTIVYQVPRVFDYDPQDHISSSMFRIQRHYLDPLVERNERMEIVPALAVSWEKIDPCNWRFHLREGVQFHNGEKFTAESVKATLERVSDPERALRLKFMWPELEVIVEDSHTVLIRTPEPMGSLLAHLTVLEMLPPQALAADEKKFIAQPVGTGPFRFEEGKRERLRLVAFDESWRGAPKVREVVVACVPDPDKRVEALLADEAQIIDRVPYGAIEELAERPGTRILQVPTVEMLFLHANTGCPPFDRREARQAVYFGLDREVIIRDVIKGAGSIATCQTNSFVFGYTADLPQYEYDPEKAKRLLAEAGYPDGCSAELLLHTFHPRSKEVGEAIAEQLEEVGIHISIALKPYGPEWLLARNARKWNLAYSSFSAFTGDGDFALRVHFHSRSSGEMYGYSNPIIDKLIDMAAIEVEEDKREELYHMINAALWSEAPSIALWESKPTMGLRNSVHGFTQLPNLYAVVTSETYLE